jgi:Tfp pilus assembly protein PilF
MARYRASPEQTPPHDDPLLQALAGLDVSARALVLRAKQLERAGRMREAEAALQQAVVAEPQSEEAHSHLVRLYHRLNDVEGAARHYRAVTAIAPNAVMANMEYGSLLAEQGRFAEAATAFERVLQGDPEHSAAHTLLAQARGELQEPAEAERHYRLALASDPNNRHAALMLGRLLVTLERVEEAEPYLAQAGEGEPRERAFYLQRIAQVWHEAGRDERALAVLGQARAQAEAQGQQRLLDGILRTQAQWQGQ